MTTNSLRSKPRRAPRRCECERCQWEFAKLLGGDPLVMLEQTAKPLAATDVAMMQAADIRNTTIQRSKSTMQIPQGAKNPASCYRGLPSVKRDVLPFQFAKPAGKKFY